MLPSIRTALAAIVLVLLLVIAGVFVWGRQGHQKAAQRAETIESMTTQLETMKTSLEAVKRERGITQTVSTKRNEAQAQINQRQVTATGKAHDAIESNPVWGTAVVPDSVWDAIQTGPYTPVHPRARSPTE